MTEDKPPFDEKDVVCRWQLTQNEKIEYGLFADEYVIVCEGTHRECYNRCGDQWTYIERLSRWAQKLLSVLQQTQRERDELKAAIATPEVYAGIVSRVLEEERDQLMARVKKLGDCRFVSDSEDVTFAECSLAEEIVCRCRDALAEDSQTRDGETKI